jgi:hypothetical protein
MTIMPTAGGAAVSPRPGEVVRIRMPWQAFLLGIASVTVSVTALTLNVWWGRSDFFQGTWVRVSWAVMVVVSVALVASFVQWAPGIDLRDDAAVVAVNFRRIEVPWRDVQAVAFGKGGSLVLYRADRTEVRCAYPCGSVPFVSWKRVDADYHRVGQWWLAHRGADWKPVFAPSPVLFPPVAPRSVEDIWSTPPDRYG